MAATTRAILRTSLKRKTDYQLTDSTDLNTLLDLADKAVQSDWLEFDRSILTVAPRDTANTSATGILLMDVNFVDLERLEDASKIRYPRIELKDRWNKTGYYFAGWNTGNTQRQIQVMKDGAELASTAMYFWALVLSPLGSQDSDEPCIPEEFRDLIAVRAALQWYEEQGTPMLAASREWNAKYNRDLERARRAYRTLDTEPVFASNADPDSGGGVFVVHRT